MADWNFTHARDKGMSKAAFNASARGAANNPGAPGQTEKAPTTPAGPQDGPKHPMMIPGGNQPVMAGHAKPFTAKDMRKPPLGRGGKSSSEQGLKPKFGRAAKQSKANPFPGNDIG
jgi:hypothetical protein